MALRTHELPLKAIALQRLHRARILHQYQECVAQLSGMPKKRSAAAEAAGDAEHDPESKTVVEAVKEEVEEEQEEEKKPKKRAKKTKEPVNEEPHVALEGPKWMIHPPWLMYRSATAIATFSCKESGTALFTKGPSTLDYVRTCSLACKDIPMIHSAYAGKVSQHHRPRLQLLTWCGPESHFSRCICGRRAVHLAASGRLI